MMTPLHKAKEQPVYLTMEISKTPVLLSNIKKYDTIFALFHL